MIQSRISWRLIVCGSLLTGCRSGADPRLYPEQPLLLSKTPVEGKIELVDSTRVARTDPQPPPMPAEALATLPCSTSPPAFTRFATPPQEPDFQEPAPLPAPIHNAVREKAVTPTMPAVRRAPPRLPSNLPRRVPGDFGHAADYTWLQGVFDRDHSGQLSLRYCDPTVEDRWGGKVQLQPDPRLSQLQAGDVVLLEGVIAPISSVEKQFPAYRVESVMLIERKHAIQ